MLGLHEVTLPGWSLHFPQPCTALCSWFSPDCNTLVLGCDREVGKKTLLLAGLVYQFQAHLYGTWMLPFWAWPVMPLCYFAILTVQGVMCQGKVRKKKFASQNRQCNLSLQRDPSLIPFGYDLYPSLKHQILVSSFSQDVLWEFSRLYMTLQSCIRERTQ